MKILVANLGSTSFKFRLFDMELEEQLARGGMERIGGAASPWRIEWRGGARSGEQPLPDHGAAVQLTLDVLTEPQVACLQSADDLSAIGFKAVHGGRYSGVQLVNDDILAAMEAMNAVAPAHNPPYIAAMRLLADRFDSIPLVAAFETGFHQTVPESWSYYGIPWEWSEALGIRRFGFHGASHRYIAERTAELSGRSDLRVVSCHLGGSSSLCAIRGGTSVATTMGMSPQSGLLHNNRVGDFDPYALPLIMNDTGMSLEAVLHRLASAGGLLGISGVSGDIRDLRDAAAKGNRRAQLALDVFVADIRRHLGSMLAALGGADWIVFTGGIGEHGGDIRAAVSAGMADLGWTLDPQRNEAAKGECRIDDESGQTQVWVIPTNEEIIVARQAYELLKE